VDPNVRTIAQVGHSTWNLFGWGFLGVGLLIAILLLAIRPWPIDIGEIAVLAGVPVFLGAVLMCVRSGVVVDRQRCVLTTWWGMLVPFAYGTERSFSKSHDVTLSYDVRHGLKYSTYAVYPVTLESPGTDAIAIHEPDTYDKARRLAEELAKFLRVGIRDRSEGDEVVREAGALDLSLRERMKRTGRSAPLPAQPPGARAILNYGASRSPTTIEIPSMPLVACLRLFLMGTAAAGIVAALLEFGAWYSGAWFSGVPFGVAALSVFLPALCIALPLVIRNAILRERLVVSPEELVVIRRDFFGTRTIRLKGAEIEEVALVRAGYLRAYGGGTSRVFIRSDRRSVELYTELANPGEAGWLRDVLVHVLTATFR
jgi:hypothetical protein